MTWVTCHRPARWVLLLQLQLLGLTVHGLAECVQTQWQAHCCHVPSPPTYVPCMRLPPMQMCGNCGACQTRVWRHGLSLTLCNACG